MKKLEVEILVTHSPFNVITKFARRKKKIYIYIRFIPEYNICNRSQFINKVNFLFLKDEIHCLFLIRKTYIIRNIFYPLTIVTQIWLNIIYYIFSYREWVRERERERERVKEKKDWFLLVLLGSYRGNWRISELQSKVGRFLN